MDATQTAQAVGALAPFVQYGFAGFAVLQLCVIVWVVRQLLAALKDSQRVIRGNTVASKAVHDVAEESRVLLKDMRERLLARPCLLVDRRAAPIDMQPGRAAGDS